MTHSTAAPLLGQLLVRAEILEPHVLNAALDKARESGLKIGQVLLYSGFISERTLRGALYAQRQVRQRALPLAHAICALSTVNKYGIDFVTAIAKLRWASGHEQIHQFARIVVEANVIDAFQLGNTMALSIRSNCPLGRILVVHDFISSQTRKLILDAVILIRCGEITFEHAVAGVKAAMRTGKPLHELLGMPASPVLVLSKEFYDSGLFTEVEVTDLVEESLQRETLWQGTAVTDNLVANLKFAATLVINRMLANGELSREQATLITQDLLLSLPSIAAPAPIPRTVMIA